MVLGKIENSLDVYDLFNVRPKYLLEYIKGDLVYFLQTESLDEAKEKAKERLSFKFYIYDYENNGYREEPLND